MLLRFSLLVLVCAVFGVPAAGAQQVTKQEIPGVVNFTRLETTVACAGATKPEAVPEIKKLGFKSIINLRLPNEAGENIDAEAAAAKEANINFFHIPFNGQSPDPAAADKFLDTITAPGNEPALIQCASGNRAAMMWMIKRMVVDHWDADRAGAEAKQLGLTNAGLQKFAVEYAASHTR